VIRTAALALGLLGASAQAALPAEILIHDAKSQPESLTLAPDGSLIAGSASSPYIYRVRPGAAQADRFVDASTEGPGTFFFGQLADPATGTLWACQLTPIAGTKPAARRTVLRALDLQTGKEKFRWTLPGNNTVCNDMAVGPDKALYLSDTANARIYRLPAGAQAADLFLEHRILLGIDGITFLDGVLYVNSVSLNKLYRIPLDAAGKPKAPEDIWMDAPVKGPDGMRAAGGRLFLAENGSGKVVALTIQGDIAHVTTLKEGLDAPTGVEPAGNMLWIAERGAGKLRSIPIR
jgi:sugar lactone lactonase YvrE